jgi:hypothetical protein
MYKSIRQALRNSNSQTRDLSLKRNATHLFAPIIVVDTGNHTIRQITEDGTVSTLCGSPGEKGSTDGKGSAARFNHPTGIALKLNTRLFHKLVDYVLKLIIQWTYSKKLNRKLSLFVSHI